MRTTTLFALGAALVIAACADDRPTSPTSSRSANGTLVGSYAAAFPPGPSANGKPVDQVGFTKITRVNGPVVQPLPGKGAESDAVCPAGSTFIGGTYQISGWSPMASPPWIIPSPDDNGRGQTVFFDNEQPGAAVIAGYAVAYCAS